MATVVYSARALEHIERTLQSLRAGDSQIAEVAASAIRTAVESLVVHPFIGRRIEGDVRELIVSYGRTGSVVMYRYRLPGDEVRVLALRHQQAVGYLP